MYIKIIIICVTFILLVFTILECIHMWVSYQNKNIKEHIGSYYNYVNPTKYDREIDNLDIDVFDPPLNIPILEKKIVNDETPEYNIETTPILQSTDDLKILFEKLLNSISICNRCNFKEKA